MPEEALLTVNNLSVAFDGTRVLSDISFSVASGEALAVIGPNGAGKSVLFRALVGLVPYEGSVTWRAGTRIGYAPQSLAVDQYMPVTVREFFLLKAESLWLPKRAFLEHLDHELALVGLEKRMLDQQIGELSGGQMQRLLISWAMLDHPDVLLFDEPTAGIDAGFAETVYTLLHRLQKERGTTVLLISHDLNVVYAYASNVLCINNKLICHGPPREVLSPAELSRVYGAGGFFHHADAHAHSNVSS